MKTYAIILAAGRGRRFGSSTPKQFLKLSGKTVIEHTISAFEKHRMIDEIIVVTSPDYVSKVEELILRNSWMKVSKVIIGGETRQESSYFGISSIEEDEAYVLIHDAVRPFVSEKVISDVLESLKKYDAVDVAIPSYDTIIKINDSMIIEDIPSRKYLWRGQTPQAFKLSVIRKAHYLAKEDGFLEATDDCSLVLKYGLADVYVISGEDRNIKITTPLDMYLADKLFQLSMTNLAKLPVDLDVLRGKVGVIFGSSRGIGKSLFQLLKEFDVKVYGFSRRNRCDVKDPKDVRDALESVYQREGAIDFVVLTAAVLRKKPLFSMTYEEVIDQVHTNYVGAINVAKESFDYLKESRGHLVFFSSSSYSRGRGFYSIYSSTKAAIVNLVQALAEEWMDFGIKVNAISPERTATPMRFENFGKEPSESLLSPEEVAFETLKVLTLDITGQVVEVKLK